jgi:hypothetical protein
MKIHRTDDNTFVISNNQIWFPGSYATEGAAWYAFTLPVKSLQRIQDEANKRAGGKGGIITYDDLVMGYAIK